MGESSKIEWCDHTLNPWISCQKVGPGCDFCYAEDLMANRYKRVQWGPHAERLRTSASTWKQPLKWEKHAGHFAELHGRRQRVFCASLADWADTHRSILPEWRRDLGALILATPSLDWLLLTKRIGNAEEVLAEMFPGGVPGNVHIGITVVNQAEADRDIPKLLALKAKLHIVAVFLSCEPLLGAINLSHIDLPGGDEEVFPLTWPEGRDDEPCHPFIDWVICGGESGSHARPMHPDWARGLRDQCEAAGTPFLMKQWGEWLPWEPDQGPLWSSQNGRVEDSHQIFPPDFDDAPGWDDGLGYIADGMAHAAFQRVGKKAAGRLLDGKEHNGFPSVQGRAL